MAEGAGVRRPGVVTLVVVLSYVAGVADIVIGVAAIFARYLPEVVAEGYGPRLVITLFGAAMVLFGLMTIALASGLARASRFARGAVTALQGSGLVLALVSFLATTNEGPSTLIVQAVVGLVVVLPLWLGRGGSYFAVR